MRFSRIFSLFLPAVVVLAGCGVDYTQPIANQIVSGLSGSAYGGQQPVVGATVTLWAVGTSGYGTGATQIATASAVTDAGGHFSFGPHTCPYSNTPTYLLASGGNPGSGINSHIVLAAASGPCGTVSSATVNINEVTTAATAYAMGQFFTTSLTSGNDMFGGQAAGSGTYNLGLVNADFYTVPTLVNLADGVGATAHTTATSGNLTRTFESAKLYSLANILAACVNTNGSTASGSNCGKLFSATNDGNGTPTDTLQAAVQIALYPYKNVSALYRLIPADSPFVGLSSQPNDWSLAISYTTSAFQLGIASTSTSSTSSNIDIDAAGNVWFPSNTAVSGVGYLDPHSSAPTFAGPYLTGLLNPQYLAITNQGRIYADSTVYVSEVGYTSTTSPDAGTISEPSSSVGIGGPLIAALSSHSEAGDDIIFSSGGNAIYVGYNWPGNSRDNGKLLDNHSSPIVFQRPAVNLAINSNGSLISSDGGSGNTGDVCDMEERGGILVQTGNLPCFAGGIAQTAYSSSTFNQDMIQTIASENSLCDYAPDAQHGSQCFTSPIALSYPLGVATDGLGNIWIANYGNASVSTLGYTFATGTDTDFHATSTVPYLHGAGHGGTMINPVGIAIDNSGNVWVSNGCITAKGCTVGSFTLSELIGAAAPTLTPLINGTINNATGTRPH